MATKIFLNNDWQDYDYEYLHDHEGYTDHETTSVTYKTTDPWGGTASNSGYCDHPSGVYDFIQRLFFVSGVVGWFSPNTLALQGYYPSDSTEFIVIKNGVVSNAVYWEDVESGDPSDTMYLVEADINTGWMTSSEFANSGWVEYIPDGSSKGYIVVDSNGSIQNSVDLDKMFIHPIQHSFEVVNFYFTSNGAAETENMHLEAGTYIVYDASGNTIDDPDTVYNGSLAIYFTEKSGSMTFADSEFLEYSDGHLMLNMDGNTRNAWSVQVEEYEDYIDLIYLASTGNYPRQSSVTSGFSGTIDNTCTVQLFLDFAKTKLVPFDNDVRYEIGYYDATGGWYPDPYLSLSDLPSDTRPPSLTDANAQLPVNVLGHLRVWEVTNATEQRTASITWNCWQIRAYSVKFNKTNLPRESAYFTSSGASGISNTTIQPSTNASVWYTLYDEHGNAILYDDTKSYSFIRCFQYNGGGTPLCGEIRFRSYNGYLQMGEVGDRFTSNAFRIEYVCKDNPFPTVSTTGDFGDSNNWLFGRNVANTTVSIPSGSYVELYDHAGSSPSNWSKRSYDDSKSYAIFSWYFGTSSADKGNNSYLSIVSSSDNYIAAKNNTGSTVILYAARVFVCSSNSANVVTVYNTNNVAYNAFVFTYLGNDYYYVLDGVQTRWIDDLNSIGYSLCSLKEAYFTNQGEAGKNTTVNASMTTLNVYDASGNKIPYDTTKTYTIISAKGTYLNNSTIQDWPSVLITNTSVINQNGFLCTYCGISSYGGFNVYISEVVIRIS